MLAFLIALIVLSAFILVIVVLAQKPKGGGLSEAFGGSGATQWMGARKSGDLMERITWIAAATIMLLSIVANIMITSRNEGFSPQELSPNVREAQRILPSFLDDIPLPEDSLAIIDQDSAILPIEALPTQ